MTLGLAPALESTFQSDLDLLPHLTFTMNSRLHLLPRLALFSSVLLVAACSDDDDGPAETPSEDVVETEDTAGGDTGSPDVGDPDGSETDAEADADAVPDVEPDLDAESAGDADAVDLGGDADAVADADVSVDAGGECTAQVVLGFFTDPDCTVPVAGDDPTRLYDTTLSCFGWEGRSAAGENSATNYQCFRDRLCYTQHPRTLDCDNPRPTNKEARTDVCILDTEGEDRSIYAMIVSGTESCPEAPEGFECPLSDIGEGTTGISECTMEP